MKLKFDSTLDYQQEAIAAVRDVFKGQTAKQSLFTVTPVVNEQISRGLSGNHQQLTLGQGIGNRLELDEEDLLKNIREKAQGYVGNRTERPFGENHPDKGRPCRGESRGQHQGGGRPRRGFLWASYR